MIKVMHCRMVIKTLPLFVLSGALMGAGPEVIAVHPVPNHSRAFNAHGGKGVNPVLADFAEFRRNAMPKPEVSAKALLKILDSMPEEKVPVFTDRHLFLIAEMIVHLDKAAEAGKLSREAYAELSSALAAFEIKTIQARAEAVARGEINKNTSPNALDSMVDVMLALTAGDTVRAEREADTFSGKFFDKPGARAGSAFVYNALKKHDTAATMATQAISLDPQNSDAYTARAEARLALKDSKGAIADINKALELDPQDESAKILAALVDSRKDKTSLKTLATADEMRKALGVESDGQIAEQAQESLSGKAGGAGDSLSAAVGSPGGKTDYAVFKTYLDEAAAKNKLGDHEAAAMYASKAIEARPASLAPYFERANAYNFLGRYDEVIKDTTYIINHDSTNSQALNMRAWALNRKGLAKDAETDASRAIKLKPDYADAWFNRALVYEKQGNYKEMLEDLKHASELDSAYSARFKDAVAQYAGQTGFKQAAGSTAVALSPEPRSGTKRFFVLMLFTLSGGILVALGLMHVFGSADESKISIRKSHPGSMGPSVLYDGLSSGKYKIERKIGEGGMGAVYEAADQSLGRKVAIKKMNEEIKVNEREKIRFLDEARTVASLRHPNIVEIYTVFEEETNIYLVFEYISGITLDDMLIKEARLSFSRAKGIFDAVAKALSYAHSKGIVHRDLKLSNIMISSENEIKVMDFGLAGHARESMAKVSKVEVVGSPAYMPPEQDLGHASKASDIYALGVCLYEVLTGSLPFNGPDFHYQKEHLQYQPASASVAGLSKGVDELIAKSLSPDPDSRFQTAEEFRTALAQL